MFGYTCQECHEGVVRRTTVRDFETKFENVPFVVPEAVIGVCDKCGARHFSGREHERWEELFRKWQDEEGRVMSPAEITKLREDLGLTKADFAALLGTTRQSLHYWEKGDREAPQSRMVDSLLKLVRKSCDEGHVDVVAFLRDCARAAGVQIAEPACRHQGQETKVTVVLLPDPADYDLVFGGQARRLSMGPGMPIIADEARKVA